MAAAAGTTANVVETRWLNLDVVCFRITTGDNGEDGVYYDTSLRQVLGAVCAGAESGKSANFYWVPNTTYLNRVTVYAPAGATGDAANVDVIAWGYR